MVNNPNCYKLKLDKLEVELLNKDRDKVGYANLEKVVEIPKRQLCV